MPPVTRPSARLAPTKERPLPGAAPLGMLVFLASLGVLFVSSLVGYAVVRLRAGPEWPPAGAPPLPASLWVSTALLVVSSATIHAALAGARASRAGAVRAGLLATALLGLGFLAAQTHAWSVLAERMPPSTPTLYSFTFYFLTALHGAHVVGGLAPLGVTTVRGALGRYGPDPEEHVGLHLMALYWHFLDVVWLVLFAVLVLVG